LTKTRCPKDAPEMPYAVTLRLNVKAAASVERIWRALAERVGNGNWQPLGYWPHLTLAVLPDSVTVKEVEEIVADMAERWEVLPVVLAGVGVFPGKPAVVWLAPIVTELLLGVHKELHAALGELAVHPHYRPGGWVPHVTLCEQERFPVALAAEVAASVWTGPITGEADRIDLVRFHPASVLRSLALRPSG
jgi:2'-5' RNA ligase